MGGPAGQELHPRPVGEYRDHTQDSAGGKLPMESTMPIDYQVIVDVERFDTGTDKQARLNARWSIRDGHDR